MNCQRQKEALENFAAMQMLTHFRLSAGRQGLRPDEAEDITQGFFAELLEREVSTRCARKRDDFVPFCLGTKIFLANEAPGDGDQARERTAAHSVG